MQHSEKTIAQLRDELAMIENATRLPGVDNVELQIYRQTIRNIKELIAQKERVAATSVPRVPVQMHPVATGNAGEDSAQRPRNNQAPLTPRRDTPHTHPLAVAQPKEDMGLVTAMEGGPVKKVKIKWHELETVELTEGETRSRFVTALRDLAESKMAAAKRWDDVARYRTFARACTYYQALCIFWEEWPSSAQLGLHQMSDTKKTILNMIQCEAIQQQEA